MIHVQGLANCPCTSHTRDVHTGATARSLLVTVPTALKEHLRQSLMTSLLDLSAPPTALVQRGGLRPLKVTVLAQSDILPWHHPATRQMQFGEWLRDNLHCGGFESPMQGPDLAILLTEVRQHSMALRRRDAAELFETVPPRDLKQAPLDTVAQWDTPDSWIGDERNIVLALARIWFTAATGGIASKDGAVNWLLPQVPASHKSLLADAMAAYLGHAADDLSSRTKEVEAYIGHARPVTRALCKRWQA